MDKPALPKPPSMLSVQVSRLVIDLPWFILRMALKGLGVMITYNLIVTNAYPNLSEISIGVAVAMVLLVKFLFSSLDGFSKYQTRHLLDLKSSMSILIGNQLIQNSSIVEALKELKDSEKDSDKANSTVSETIDETRASDYNTDTLEK